MHRSRSVPLLLLLLLLFRLSLRAPCRFCDRCTTRANGHVADVPRDAVATGHHLLTGTAIGLIVEDVATDQNSGRIEGFDLHASRIRRTVVAEWLHVDFVGDRPCGPQMSGVLVGAWDLEIEGPHGTADAGVGAPLPNDPGLIPESFVYLTSRHSGTAHENRN